MNFIKRISNWEQWPFKVLYAPIAPVWLWYMLRSKAVWFFTTSNPKLTFGGMDGEPKREMHELLEDHLRPAYFNVDPASSFCELKKQLESSGIRYPLIVKPEIGGKGILFRKIETERHLQEYHSKVPVEYFVQEFVSYPLEVSLFYCRYPSEITGKITGFLKKVPMQVIGDGIHTLEQLLKANNKTKKRIAEIRLKHDHNFQKIVPAGKVYMLSYAANHNRGAHFIDLKDEICDELVILLDEISLGINDFFYGRYDIMCNSIEELKKGKNFVILEYNGCGAEPNHFYDTGYTLRQAWKEILKHWRMLYEISRYNYEQGIEYWPLMKGMRFLIKTKKYYKIINQADREIS